MSRGPGKLQRSILEGVAAQPGISDGRLRWTLAERADAIAAGRITQRFYSNFQRALASLADEPGTLRVETRPLESFDEVVEHYPFKTTVFSVRQVREQFLPRLARFLGEQSKFSSVESERHVLSRRREAALSEPTGRGQWRQSAKKWAQLDAALVSALPMLPVPLAPAAIDLLIKGREYFAPKSGYRLDRALRQLLHELSETVDAPAVVPVTKGLATLCDQWLPADNITSANLKGQLYQLVDFSLYTRPSLHTTTEMRLFAHYGDELCRLPGHQSGVRRLTKRDRERLAAADARMAPVLRRAMTKELLPKRFSPLVNKILERSVLSPFRFLLPA